MEENWKRRNKYGIVYTAVGVVKVIYLNFFLVRTGLRGSNQIHSYLAEMKTGYM